MSTKIGSTDTGQTPPPEPRSDLSAEGLEETAQSLGQGATLIFRVAFQAVLGVIAYFGELVSLLGQAIVSLRGLRGVDLLRQMSIIGVDTVPIALLTVGFTGAVLALYSVGTLRTYGATGLVGGIVALSITRESGPILAGVMVAARAGSAMTAEIASMKVSEQIDALRSMGISPIEYLVVPRIVAAILMVPMLTLLADFAGVFGGGVFASYFGLPWSAYLNSVRQLMEPDASDITKGLVKTIFFGLLVALVGCRAGLRTEGGAVGVGNSTTRSVVLSIVLIFIANFVLSYLLFRNGLGN
ncbi:MAG: ABC transporter permease [Capsulimonadales bacterium]|nr:ABC transporter permease [Capsulimonadales bacterium]